MDRLALLRFWEIVYHLVNTEGMRVVHFSRTGREVWMEDDRKEPYQIIRFVQKDFDWSNELRSDIKSTYDRAVQVKKQLGLRSANVVNLILSQYQPVDSYEELLDQALPFTAGGKGQQRTILLSLDGIQEQLFPLATEWKLSQMPTFSSYEQVDEEEEVIGRLRHSVQQASEKRFQAERNIFLFGKPIFTYSFLSLIILVFLYVEWNGSSTSTESLIRFGAKFNPLILEGEWWRFFSAMFLHIGIFHLLMNSMALYFLGGTVERIYGSLRFFFIYFLAGLVGSVASFAFNEQVAAGASGAIFGCFGALLYFGIIHKRLFFRTMGMNVIIILLINLVFGFTVPMVDNGAHIGGLIGGFAASAIVGLPKQKLSWKRLLFTILTASGILGLLHYGYSQEVTGQTYIVYFQLGHEYVAEDNVEEARTYFEKIIDATKEVGLDDDIVTSSYFLLAYTQATMGDLEEAEENLLLTIQRDPSLHEAYYNLSLIYLQWEQYDDALLYVGKALDRMPNEENYQKLDREINLYLDR